jgi:hypothetical protein
VASGYYIGSRSGFLSNQNLLWPQKFYFKENLSNRKLTLWGGRPRTGFRKSHLRPNSAIPTAYPLSMVTVQYNGRVVQQILCGLKNLKYLLSGPLYKVC